MLSTILVHVDSLAASNARTQLAIDLALKFEATLIGFTAALPRLPLELYDAALGTAAIGPDYGDIDRTELEEEFARNQATFTTAAKAAGVKSNWRAAFASPSTAIAGAATAADLVVLGSGDRSLLANLSGPSADDVVLHIGRPILVVPAAYAGTALDTVVVAWKDAPESQRALSDAVPFMKGAAKVVIFSVQEGDEAAPSLADAAGFLSGHGIAATTETRRRGRAAVEDEVFDFATRQQAGLIVAGAYGHTRLREWVFGGVTRGLLSRSPVPCLLSH
jgi:nucleotide-binding universal stress UspA family protein